MWRCKDCDSVFSRRSELLKHYKLNHKHYGQGHSYPCTYLSCACRFKTWNALLSHLSRNHPVQQTVTKDLTRFKCPSCDCSQLFTERDFFQHIFQHLKNKETVTCVFQDCAYKTNIYENFKSHKYRKHSDTCNIFKPGITEKQQLDSGVQLCAGGGTDIFDQESIGEANLDPSFNKSDSENLEKDIELKLASVLLRLESSFLVSNAAINELLQELNYLIGSLSLPITYRTITQILHDHLGNLDQSLVEKLAKTLCETNPVKKAIEDRGSLSTAWRRKAFYKRHFKVVEPEEYILDKKKQEVISVHINPKVLAANS
ncbi:transcription factor IIIA isoform X2 [Austrofundulus limnaeus]|uniref:Transcription factor IIIA-like isoform X1 n=1 Tax=Austrofundulus limnaeus TaxID=52670 RepID=A0A2I4CWW2_AUSLI|nr:PREDICTED: transcription factor IIIA-like isoform X1 [Austrofundulus limnaeus]XP_013884488.1 PREDICTED: transcription factor IIIA-like isoform X2 [Austrofundulus limnaeus]